MSHLSPLTPRPDAATDPGKDAPVPGARRPVRPGWIEVGAAAAGYLAMYLVARVVLHAIPTDHPVAIGLAAYALSALSGIVAFLIALAIRIRTPSVFGLRRVKLRWLWAGVGFGVVAFALSWAASAAYAALTSDHSNVQTGYGAAATGGTLSLIATLLLGAVATPIGEELAFRGVLANALERYGAWVAVLGSAIVFAFAHGLNPVFPVALIEGAIAALLFRKTHSIWPAVMVHLVNNTLATSLSVLAAHAS